MLAERLRQFRLARALSLEDLSSATGGLVTRQAISKYETGQMQPSARVLAALARALDIQTSSLLRAPCCTVDFIAYRKTTGLGKRDRERIQALLTGQIEERVRLQRLIYGDINLDLPIHGFLITNLGQAEEAADRLRDEWSLGRDPIANLTATLEDLNIHVLQLDAPEKFDGLSAVGRNENGAVVAAAVATRRKVSGERQRLNLAHEMGHVVLKPSKNVNEEAAAFRFGAAFLAPRESIYRDVGRKRSFVDWNELRLLKRKFGLSIQALIRRLRDLEVIGDSQYREWNIAIRRAGIHRHEPDEMPEETSEWHRLVVLRALNEGALSKGEAETLLGERLDRSESPSLREKKAFMRLSPSERRQLLSKQAAELKMLYKETSKVRNDWQGGDLVEYDRSKT